MKEFDASAHDRDVLRSASDVCLCEQDPCVCNEEENLILKDA